MHRNEAGIDGPVPDEPAAQPVEWEQEAVPAPPLTPTSTTVLLPAPASFTEKLKSRKFWATVVGVLGQFLVLVPVYHLPVQWAAILGTALLISYVGVQGVADILTEDNQPIVLPPGAQANIMRRSR